MSDFKPAVKFCDRCCAIKPMAEFWEDPKGVSGYSTRCKRCQKQPVYLDVKCKSCGVVKTYKRVPKTDICASCINKECKNAGITRSSLMERVVSSRQGYRHWKFSLPKFLRDILNATPPELVNRDYTLKQLRMLEYNPRRKARLLAAPTNFTYLKWIEKVNYYGWRCVYCGVKLNFDTLTMNHFKPLFLGGTHFIANLVPACWGCNGKKNIETRWKIVYRS